VILSFTWDFRRVIAGNMPRPFAWWLFVAGEVTGVGSFLWASLKQHRLAGSLHR